jgi:hypothetical protein
VQEAQVKPTRKEDTVKKPVAKKPLGVWGKTITWKEFEKLLAETRAELLAKKVKCKKCGKISALAAWQPEGLCFDCKYRPRRAGRKGRK